MTTRTDYHATVEAVRRLMVGNDEQQVALRSILPVLQNIPALQAEEAAAHERIKALQAEEAEATRKLGFAEAEAGTFIGEYRQRRAKLESELGALEEKVALARKAAARAPKPA